MEKLIDLINESEDGYLSYFTEYDNKSRTFKLNNGQSFHYTLILSKEYRFIQRLVENDKIDFVKLDDNSDWYEINTGREYLDLVALLSIQDDPVKFLISILK